MAQTTTHYIRLLTDHAARLGFDTNKMLAELDIPPAATNQNFGLVDNALLASLIQWLWRSTNDEFLGFCPGKATLGTFAFAADYLIHSQTLREFYRHAHRLMKYVHYEPFDLSLREEEGNAILHLDFYDPEIKGEYFMPEFWSTIWHRFPCWIINEKIPLISASFSYPPPQHHHLYKRLFECDVSFNHHESNLVFNAKYLQHKICRTKKELGDFLQHSPADLLYIPGEETSISIKVKRILLHEVDDKLIFQSFEDTCNKIFMTPQTVRRRLVEEGTSYQKIKDALRRDIVMEKLKNIDIPIGEIAYFAGFTEPAALTRAFKRWTGMSPATYRQTHTRSK